MSDSSSNIEKVNPPPGKPREYVVVARRYRPQTFDELVGQEHIARALSNAISTNRVGHAYLFTGARGVGKTSAARILAKALTCLEGPAPVPCNRCDICQSVSSGEDIDVLEIDGASNRGIDEIRQLRQNVNIRPSRSRFKIYIIDEVHMLTREAFNALLKTLEEPPAHVKFIFCTTEPTKIPVTILSRCQRYDFAGILTASIAGRLRQIVESEGVSAEPEALEILARRAAGSMRDGQSLLEQLLAFAPERIAAADVHGMLGSAGEERLEKLVRQLADRDAAAALAELDGALHEGVDLAQLLEQLFGYFRDCMATAVGCPAETFLYASPGKQKEVEEIGHRLGLETLLAAMQILEQTLSHLRYSTHVRTLAELALVRISNLEDLTDLPALIAQLQCGTPVGVGREASPATTSGRGSPAKKNADPSGLGTSARSDTPPSVRPKVELTPQNAPKVWAEALSKLSGIAVEYARDYASIATSAPNCLVICLKAGYTLAKSVCERPEQLEKFEQALADVAGHPVRVQFTLSEAETSQAPEEPSARAVSPHQRIVQVAQHPMVRRAGELFGAQPMRVDDPPNEE